MYKRIRRRKNVKKVDMKMVQMLLAWQQEYNEIFKDTKYSCSLRPKPEKPCYICMHFKDCYHYRWEREYIQKQKEINETSKIREMKNERIEQKNKIFDSHEVKKPVYPCKSFAKWCPDRENCQEGILCTWEEET